MVSKRTLPGLTLAALLCLPAASHAITAKQLLDTCEAVEAYCLGFVSGHIDLHMSLVAKGLVNDRAFCWPSGASYDQGRLIFLKWARGNPEHLHVPAADMVSLALIASFPCATPTPEPTPLPRSQRRGF